MSSALICEDGTVVAGADSYVTLEYAATYHLNRGNAAWDAATSDQQEAAIRQATTFLDMRYLNRWKGVRLNALQPRQFPRYGIRIGSSRTYSAERFDVGPFIGLVPSNIVPEPIKHGTCELALRALAGQLAPDLKRGGQVRRKTVDVLTTEYEPGASPVTVYDFVELVIGDFLEPKGVCRIQRA